MKNWLKNNKFKIAILPIVLLLGIFIGGCTNSDAVADSRGLFDDDGFASEIVVDRETNVEYIVVRRGINVYGITPRLHSNGKPMIQH
ncbi:DUF6440 family protein [Limosilactobacillus fermentum]|uniref:DUF6440 family protein n=1 Tax=Limosilactobacillus fermentum TaxID=1613 RepID=UPI001E3438F0|nr:DUF6440 family protein [Limosilactobacillus fermentum]MCD5422967.1 DUF6440 family protein [Limosilactobacillus fermentum]